MQTISGPHSLFTVPNSHGLWEAACWEFHRSQKVQLLLEPQGASRISSRTLSQVEVLANHWPWTIPLRNSQVRLVDSQIEYFLLGVRKPMHCDHYRAGSWRDVLNRVLAAAVGFCVLLNAGRRAP